MKRSCGTSPRRGLALIEMALLMPLLVLLILGLVEYGWLFMKLQQANGAAREGVRVGVRQSATDTDVQLAVEHIMASVPTSAYLIINSGVNVAPGETVSIEVKLSYDDVGLILVPLVPTPEFVWGRATMAKEGPIAPPPPGG